MTSPSRGRQAEARRNDRRVFEAAREVFFAEGFDAPMGAVAKRAGVGIGSLYRRYASKDELLQHLCVLSMEQNVNAAEGALRAADAWEGLAGYVRACVGFSAGAFAPIAGQIEVTPEMRTLSRRARELLEQVVERARADGSLRDGVEALDVAWLIEHFAGPFPALPTPERENVRKRLLAISIDGLRPGGGGPLPGPPPTAYDYEHRWQRRDHPPTAER